MISWEQLLDRKTQPSLSAPQYRVQQTLNLPPLSTGDSELLHYYAHPHRWRQSWCSSQTLSKEYDKWELLCKPSFCWTFKASILGTVGKAGIDNKHQGFLVRKKMYKNGVLLNSLWKKYFSGIVACNGIFYSGWFGCLQHNFTTIIIISW